MQKTNSINAILSLPLALLLWQGSSCGSTNSRVSNDSGATNINRTMQNQDLNGLWGGLHIALEMKDAGAEINYDCAHGRITETIVPDRDGNFRVDGIHVKEHPGPVREGEDNEQPASYRGSIQGDVMTLTVTLTKTNEEIGTFTLNRGSSGRVHKCM